MFFMVDPYHIFIKQLLISNKTVTDCEVFI